MTPCCIVAEVHVLVVVKREILHVDNFHNFHAY